MLKKQIEVGKTYAAKVSGNIVPVQIRGESRYGGWDAVNRVTGRAIRIKSAAKLRFEMENCTPDPRTGRSWRRVQVPVTDTSADRRARSEARQDAQYGVYEKAEAALDYTPRSLDEIIDALTDELV